MGESLALLNVGQSIERKPVWSSVDLIKNM